MDLIYRWAISRDFPEIVEINRRAFVNPWPEHDLQLVRRQTKVVFKVAEVDREVAGFCIYELLPESFAVLLMATSNKYARQGIATGFLENLTGKILAKPTGKRTMVEVDIPESAKAMQKCLSKIGFTATKIIRDQFETEDGYHFEYRLPPEDYRPGPVLDSAFMEIE